MQTKDRSVVANAVIEWLRDDASLGLEEVFYGDEPLVKRTPTVSVLPGAVTRELVGAQFISRNNFSIILTVYHGRAGAGAVTRQSADDLAEAIENRLHENRTMNGSVVHGFVSSIEPGHIPVGGVLYVGTQLTWTAISKTRLNMGG